MVKLKEEKILEHLNTIGEHKMAKEIFVPLLKKMGLKGVRYTGGSSEYGIDIEYYEYTDPENERSYVGIQFKQGNLRYSSRGGKNTIIEIKNQAEEAFEKEIRDVNSATIHYIERFIVATTGEINDSARTMINKAKMKGQGRRIRFWDGEQLAEYVNGYWLEEFINYFGIVEAGNVIDCDDEKIYSVIDADYIESNYPDLVGNCKRVKATIGLYEWKILSAIIALAYFRNNEDVSMSDLLFEIEKSEDNLRDELTNLASLEYIEYNDYSFSIVGKARFLSSLADKIISEIIEAEENPDGAEEIFCEILK